MRCHQNKKIALSIVCFLFLLLLASYGQQTPPPVLAVGALINCQKTWAVKRPLVNDADIPSANRTTQEVTQAANYSDGFGRPFETVIKQAGPSPYLNDMVLAHAYDSYGNESISYMPFASTSAQSGDVINDGNLKTDVFQQQIAFFNAQLSGQANETNVGPSNLNWAYEKTNFEFSPLNRPVKQFAAGINWVGSESGATPHSIQKLMWVNTALDTVRIWNIQSAQGSLPTTSNVYLPGALSKIVTTNELGIQEIEFKDQYGQLILKKVQLSSTPDNGAGVGHANWQCTYYVYDDYGNLRFVITPFVVAQIAPTWVVTQSLADEFCYRIEYDQINRPIVKKSPGAAEVWLVYDQWNREVLYQDGNSRAVSQWIYTKYDGLDRVVVKGIYTNSSYTSQSSMQSYLTSLNLGRYETFQTSSYPYYTLTPTFPAVTVSTVSFFNYYDGYSWGGIYGYTAFKDNSFDGNFQTPSNTIYPYPQSINQSAYTQGMTTGYWDASSVRAFFYDNNGAVIQLKNYNLSTGVDILTTQYNYAGKTIQTYLRQQIAGSVNPQTHTVLTKIDYDPMLRVLDIHKNIDGLADQIVSTLQYNQLGQLGKRMFGSNIESQSYDYDVRGWKIGANRNYLAGTSNNYFGYELAFDQSASMAAGNSFIPVFNGNAAGQAWKSAGDGVNRKFDFTYDNANQIVTAPFKQNTTGSAWDNSTLDFSVSGMSYDLNGNRKGVIQNGFVLGSAPSQPIDNLTFSYVVGVNPTSRLQNVTDANNNPSSTLGDFHYASSKPNGNIDYNYDNNGNIITDYNRSIASITYNNLNLPVLITITGKGTIQYIYDAQGNRLQKIVTDNTAAPKVITTTTDYMGSFVYKTKKTNPADPTDYSYLLQFVSHETGRARYFSVAGSVPAHYSYDYFLRDYQGNVRMVLTDEVQSDIYPPATVETTSFGGGVPETFESKYYQINPADIISVSTLPWYNSVTGHGYLNENNNGTPANLDPYSQPAVASGQAYKLNGQSGDKYGLGITLKVMAGDKISIFANSFWHNTGQTVSPFPITSILSGFIGAFGNSSNILTGAQTLPTGTTLNGISSFTGALTGELNGTTNQPSPTTQPKAAINWILFNDQFTPVSIGTDLVSSAGDIVKNHSILNTPMAKNGYLYVYCSDESNIDVYFDNLQVTNTRGPILEETHYYPQGLTMAGISDHAWNKQPNFYHFTGNEMQNQEFSDGTGLEEYNFHARFYDQQLGVWHSQDPSNQFASPYAAMANSWPNGTDKNGQLFGIDDAIAFGIGFVAGFLEYGFSEHRAFTHIGKALESALIDGLISEAGYLTLGGGLSDVGKLSTTLANSSLAVPYAASYGATSAFTYAQNYEQISSAGSSARIGLLAGYSATSAITAGFNSQNTANEIDKVLKISKTSLFSGGFSQGIGGAISNAGNNILQNGGGWQSSSGFSLVSGFVSSFSGQISHNAVGGLFPNGTLKDGLYPYYSAIDVKKNFFANISSGLTQQLFSNWASQIGVKNGYQDVGNPNTGDFLSSGHDWWGAYLNGLGGFQSDMYYDSH